MRRTSFDHLVNHDPKTPNIGFCIIGRNALYNFRRHPVRGASQGVPLTSRRGKEGGDTEVTDHDFAGGRDEDVCCFHITVDDWYLVEVA